jgi:hypothetical protein
MNTEIVKFYGNDLTCVVEESGQILVVVKPICDALGLDSEWQVRAISEDEVLVSERCEHTVQIPEITNKTGSDPCENNRKAGENLTRKMICLPLEFINGWLFQIKFTNTMSEETKEKLIAYKRKCYKALFNHFFGNFKKQLESNEIEINLLTEINEMNEQKKHADQ